MKLKIHFLIISIFSLSLVVQSVQAADQKLVNSLRDYLEIKKGMSGEHCIDIYRQMVNAGQKPLELAIGLLNDVQYSEYWTDALPLMAASLHKDDPVQLADRLIQFFNKEETIVSLDVIKSKGWSILLLKELVGPNYKKDGELMDKIMSFADDIFSKSDPTDPQYWINRFKLDKLNNLSSNSDVDLQKIQSRIITNSRTFVEYAASLYAATNNEFYLKFVEKNANSSYDQIRITSQYCLTESYKKSWDEGYFEIFDYYYRKPIPTKEEIENAKRVLENTGRDRLKQNKN